MKITKQNRTMMNIKLTREGALAYRAKEIGKFGQLLHLAKGLYDCVCPVSNRGRYRNGEPIGDVNVLERIKSAEAAMNKVRALSVEYFEVVSVDPDQHTMKFRGFKEACAEAAGFKPSKGHLIAGVVDKL